MDSWPCSMATTDALSRDILAPCMQRPQSQSHTAVTVPKPRCMHALPGHVRHHVLLVKCRRGAGASHGFGIIGLGHCRQLLPCLSNQACTVHLQASMQLSPSVAAQTHHEHNTQAHLPMIGGRQCVYNVTLADCPLPITIVLGMCVLHAEDSHLLV
jgi:hypothetical protein